MHFAASEDRVDAIGVLLDLGAPVDIKDEHGRTPLYYAVIRGQMAAAVTLVGRGASLFLGKSRYPLVYLALKTGGVSELAKYLLELEAKDGKEGKINAVVKKHLRALDQEIAEVDKRKVEDDKPAGRLREIREALDKAYPDAQEHRSSLQLPNLPLPRLNLPLLRLRPKKK